MLTNPHTGQKLQTKPSSSSFRDNWDLIFTKKAAKDGLVQQFVPDGTPGENSNNQQQHVTPV